MLPVVEAMNEKMENATKSEGNELYGVGNAATVDRVALIFTITFNRCIRTPLILLILSIRSYSANVGSV